MISNFSTILLISYLLSKSMNNDDVNNFKIAIYKKIFDCLPTINNVINQLNNQFNISPIYENEINSMSTIEEKILKKVNNFVSKLKKEQIKNLPFEILQSLNDKK